jgi:hypothetical protein
LAAADVSLSVSAVIATHAVYCQPVDRIRLPNRYVDDMLDTILDTMFWTLWDSPSEWWPSGSCQKGKE